MNSSNPQVLFLHTYAGVRQDKVPPMRNLESSDEPYTFTPQRLDRPKHHGSEKRQKVHMSTRVPSHVKVAYKQMAKNRGGDWTESSVLAEAAEDWLASNMGEKFSIRMKAFIDEAVDRKFNQHMNPLRKMQAKTLKDLEELRFILEGISSPEQIAAAKKLAVENIKG